MIKVKLKILSYEKITKMNISKVIYIFRTVL